MGCKVAENLFNFEFTYTDVQIFQNSNILMYYDIQILFVIFHCIILLIVRCVVYKLLHFANYMSQLITDKFM